LPAGAGFATLKAMNQSVTFLGLPFLIALAVGTYQVQHGKPGTGLLLISFGLLGLLKASRLGA